MVLLVKKLSRMNIYLRLIIVLTTIKDFINANKVCNSIGCQQTAKTILENMDSTVNPCDDFYAFSCGGFINKTIVPNGEEKVNVLTKTKDGLISDINDLMNEELNSSELQIFKDMKTFYKTCIDENKIEELGVTPMKDILKQMGGWPVIECDSWSIPRQTYRWYNETLKLRKLGFSAKYFLNFLVETDIKNPNKRIITLDQPYVGFSKFLLQFGNDSIIEYIQYMVNMAVLLGATEEKARKEMLQVFEFQSLMNISIKDPNLTDQYELMKVKDLRKLDGCIDWQSYINGMISNSSIFVEKEEEVVVYGRSYIEKLKNLILKTPIRVQANYMLWRVVEDSLLYLNKEAQDIANNFVTPVFGYAPETDRTKVCYKIVEESIGIGMSSMYIRRYLAKIPKDLSVMLDTYLKNEYLKSLSEVSWMDDETKKRAEVKMRKMKILIGYPPELLSDVEMKKYHQGLQSLEKDKHFTNMLSLMHYSKTKDYSLLRVPVTKNHWTKSGTIAIGNGAYRSLVNAYEIYAGIIRGIIYAEDRPKYINFALLAFIAGHEITHAFDVHGRTINEKGEEENWWSNATLTMFEDKKQCLINQYNNYEHSDDTPLNGEFLLSENMADNVGINVAHKAYLSAIKNDVHDEDLLPGLNYTQEQLYWISSANLWCSVYNPEYIFNEIFDDHSPNKYRVIGPLSNRPEFSKAFHCAANTPMNRTEKCQMI
ncbi:LOW QUALITY PROTEIN: neprilysin-2-like [Lepeophtheirus salmonis]|uniref:LOW QUALITY PROTEIN: neprilysin-2-like n=1 Tax=Lepeophtheirus salmonis TaxID=72036 RepID=UPI003AF3F5CF